MGDIKNKFDGVIEQLNEQEQLESAKSKKVVQAIAGRTARRKKEERKVLPTVHVQAI